MFARYYLHLAGAGRWADLVDRGRLPHSAQRHLNPMTVAASENRYDMVIHVRLHDDQGFARDDERPVRVLRKP